MTRTTINVRLVRRPRVPMLRAHGLLAPLTAMINLTILLVVFMYFFFKITAVALYLGGRQVGRAVSATRRRARYPRVTREFHWEK